MSLNGYAAVRMCLMSDSVLLSVWLTPRAARDEVVGWQAGELRLRLRAPPVEGPANEAVRRFPARAPRPPPQAPAPRRPRGGRASGASHADRRPDLSLAFGSSLPFEPGI